VVPNEPSSRSTADVLFLLERLDEVVGAGVRLPLTSRVLIDEHELLEILDQVKLALPEQLKEARRLLAQREQLLAEAAERAEHLVARAEEQIARLIDEHEIARSAEERAHRLLEGARREADDVRRQADEYAHQVLQSLQRRLRRLDRAVAEELAELPSDREPPPAR
jgi:cell division septum initiation protein DivIVA